MTICRVALFMNRNIRCITLWFYLRPDEILLLFFTKFFWIIFTKNQSFEEFHWNPIRITSFKVRGRMKDRLANLNSTLRIYDENAKLFNFSFVKETSSLFVIVFNRIRETVKNWLFIFVFFFFYPFPCVLTIIFKS